MQPRSRMVKRKAWLGGILAGQTLLLCADMINREGPALSTPPACTMLLKGGSQQESPLPLNSALASSLQETSHMASLKQPCSRILSFSWMVVNIGKLQDA